MTLVVAQVQIPCPNVGPPNAFMYPLGNPLNPIASVPFPELESHPEEDFNAAIEEAAHAVSQANVKIPSSCGAQQEKNSHVLGHVGATL